MEVLIRRGERVMCKRILLILLVVTWFLAHQAANAKESVPAPVMPAQVTQAQVSLLFDEQIKPVVFAVREIQDAVQEKGYRLVERAGDIQIVFEIQSDELEPQCYRLRNEQSKRIRITGGDPTGCMYGGLELAEKIRLGEPLSGIETADGEPYISKRGLKFNIPLDARTPSYDDTGDAAQNNIAEMWNFEFWKEFLDNMARHRYNTLTLWNPHPFPSMVKVTEFPDAALEDVCVTTEKPVAKPGEWNEPQLVAKKVVENLTVVKKMTIEEKIEYWRKVMRYAKGRGMEIYFITWNVCMNSVAPPLKDKSERKIQYELKGKYGVSNSQTNPATKAYLRASVRDFILTYPDLAGIGVTAGENMGGKESGLNKEQWLWETYGLGVLDAKKIQPDRKVKFIHRYWQSGVKNIMDEWKDYPDSFELSFKYARARLYSSTKPPFCREMLEQMKPYGLKSWWNLRNDDIFVHRWGGPDYVRDFILNFPYEQTAGYHMGSDGYVWGREFTSLEPESPRQLEIVKHWYNFMLWGRLGYNPKLNRSFFEKVLAAKFPEVDASLLYDTWAASSKITPQVNRFHWRNWDHQWSVEGCMDARGEERGGFHSVEEFLNPEWPTMEESGIMTIPDYVDSIMHGRNANAVTALQVADNLEQWANKALEGVKQINDRCRPSKELRQTLGDIESMSWLGKYYASKIRGTFDYAMSQVTNYPTHKQWSIEHLTKAIDHWTAYAKKASSQYKPQLLARTRHLDWWKLAEYVKKDVEIVRNSKPRTLKLSEIPIHAPP